MFNIYLDDVREAPEDYVRVKTVEECQMLLANNPGKVYVLSLDNDLGEPGIDKEGRSIPFWIAEQNTYYGLNLWPCAIRIHSANAPARLYMEGVLTRYGCYRWDVNESAFIDDSRF